MNEEKQTKGILVVACDHRGHDQRRAIADLWKRKELPFYKNYELYDVNKDKRLLSKDSIDYPYIAHIAALRLRSLPDTARGILICGTGSGMCIAANRYSHIRALHITFPFSSGRERTIQARNHNDINVLCLPEDVSLSLRMIFDAFLFTPCDKTERYVNRRDMLRAIGEKIKH